jgi:hypothetical protein
MYEFSGNPPVEAEKQPEGTLLFKSSALIYWSTKKAQLHGDICCFMGYYAALCVKCLTSGKQLPHDTV